MSDSNKDAKKRVKITDIQGDTFLCVASFCIFLFFTSRMENHLPGQPLFFALLPIIMPFLLSFVVGWLASRTVCKILIYIKCKDADHEHD